MKDNKNELNADVKSWHAESILFSLCQKPSNKVTSLLCSLWPCKRKTDPGKVFHTLKSPNF